MTVNKMRRQEEIRRFINNEAEVSIEVLCHEFKASEATIRRALKELSARGLIKRTRGGAQQIIPNILEAHVFQRSSEQDAQKESIADATANLVEDGDTVFLGSGSTVLAVANKLKQRRNLTVISNSLPVINIFANYPNISVIVLGGLLRQSELSMIGHITEQAINELRADVVILGIRAIDLEKGLSNDYLPETITDRAIVNLAQKVILVADHTKFGKVATAFVAALSEVNTIVTDWEISSEVVSQIKTTGVNLVVAPSSSGPDSI